MAIVIFPLCQVINPTDLYIQGPRQSRDWVKGNELKQGGGDSTESNEEPLWSSLLVIPLSWVLWAHSALSASQRKGFYLKDFISGPFPPHIHTLSEEQGLDGAGCEALRPLAEARRQSTTLPCPGEEPALSHWSYSC